MLVAEYQTLFPSKVLLRAKLHELYEQLVPGDEHSPGRPRAAVKKARTASKQKQRRR